MSFLYKPKTKNGILIKLPQAFHKVLVINGAWPTDGDVTDLGFQYKSKLYDLYGWIAFLNMTFIDFSEVTYLIANAMDILKAVESFCTSMIGLFVVLRSLHFRIFSNKLKRLLIIFSKEIWIDGEKYPRRVKTCNRIMRPVFVYFVLMFLVLVLYAIIPIFVFYKTNQTLDSKDKRLPYSMIFPYDVQKDSLYVVTYVAAVLAGWVIISHFYAHDAILLFFVSYLCGQFEILHGDIVRLVPECHAEWQQRYNTKMVGSEGDGVEVNIKADAGLIKLLQDMYTRRLQELSARHNDLISFCKQLNDLISFPLLMNVVNSTFLICFCGFQFLIIKQTGTTSFSEFMLFSSFLLSVTLQLFVICNCGTLLISYSVKTAMYLYMCNWEGGKLSEESPLLLEPENMDVVSLNNKLPLWKVIKYYPAGKDFRNKLRFMIMRCHRPVELNGMKFTVLSLEGFTKILSSSMSYFALLNTFLNKQN